MARKDYDYLFKIVIIGDSGVGKSAIMLRKCDEIFDTNYISTIGVDFRYKIVDAEDKKIKLQIWDTAGQDRFRTITRSYYRGADGIIIVYDVTNKNSFDHVKIWINECEKNSTHENVKILIANKCDDETNRKITKEQGKKLAEEYGMAFYEVSAKSDINIDETFTTLTKKMLGSNLKSIKDESIIPPTVSSSNSTCCNI